MKLKELLVAISRKGYSFQVFPNDAGGYNYKFKFEGDNFCLVTGKDEIPRNLFYDNPAGLMRFETYQDVYDNVVEGKDTGKWEPSRWGV